MLKPPPWDFAQWPLTVKPIRIERIHRISPHERNEPFCGRSGGNRFDAPHTVLAPKARYGVCYLGLTLKAAIAESVLHDETPVRGIFKVDYESLAAKFLVRFRAGQGGPEALSLADLTGESLRSLGVDGSISTEIPLDTPQLWSHAVHEHPKNVDGILYVSRHLNTGRAIALFERAAEKLRASRYLPLMTVPRIRRTLAGLRIEVQDVTYPDRTT